MLGSQRRVFRLGRYVIKVPRLPPWIALLEGMRANLEERSLWRQFDYAALCPVLYCNGLGLFLIMPFARPLSETEWEALDTDRLAAEMPGLSESVTADFKSENFGMLNGRPVKLDYGGCW